MQKQLLRIGLAAVSTAAAVLIALWAWPRLRRPPELLQFHELDDADLAPLEGTPGERSLFATSPEQWKYYLDERQAGHFIVKGLVYDPWTYTRTDPFQDFEATWPEHPKGHWRMRTNSEGLREDGELSDPPADLRVLVAGDSHTFGICANSESFANVLEARLAGLHPGKSVEVLNAGDAGFSFYNYFGTLLRFQAFAPQVFVVAVYAGNDFVEVPHLYRRFRRERQTSRPKAFLERRRVGLAEAKHAMGQCFNSLLSLARLPGEYDQARAAAIEVCTEMQQVCDERGIAMLVCLLPSACPCESGRAHEEIDRAKELLELTPEELCLNARLASDFLADLARAGIVTLDMTPIFAAQPEPPFWDLDLHMDVDGHRLVAEALEPLVEARLPR